MKVALATWNGRISPVFDVAQQVQMLDIEKGRVAGWRQEALPGTEPQAQADRLAEFGTQVLICGAVSQPMAGILAARKIRVIPFTAGDVEQVVGAWLLGTLPNPELSMPGCCGQRRRCHGGRTGVRNGRGWTNRKDIE